MGLRNVVTTIGGKNGMKKHDLVLSSVQPKKLFGDATQYVKKPLKSGPVIPSRYNQETVNSSMKKKDIVVERKCKIEGKVKRKLEIPSEIMIPKRLDLDENENENDDVIDVAMMPLVLLQRIRVVRCVDDPGKKSYFQQEEEEEVCQKLSFD